VHGPTDIRRSLLTWGSAHTPGRSYVDVKGDAKERTRDYLLKCTVFSGTSPPLPELGELSDIYLDTHARSVYVKTKDYSWETWTIGKKIVHPLGVACNVYAQRTHGIKWQTSNAHRIQKSIHKSAENSVADDFDNLDAAIKQTLVYHKYLDPSDPEGVGMLGHCKEVRPKKVKVEAAEDGKMRKKKVQTTSSVEPPSISALVPPPVPPPVPLLHSDEEMPDADLFTNVQNPDIIPPSSPIAGLPFGDTNMADGFLPKFDDIEINMDQDDKQQPRWRRPHNKRVCIHSESRESSPLSPLSALPKPTYILLVASAAVPLFQRLLNKPKAWLMRAGIEFPQTAQLIEWANGVWTVLPWQTCDRSIAINPVWFILPLYG
jgi:hypothetical protein